MASLALCPTTRPGEEASRGRRVTSRSLPELAGSKTVALGGLCLRGIPRDQGHVAAPEHRKLFERDGQVHSVKRAHLVLDNQAVCSRKNSRAVEPEQRDWAIVARVGVEAIDERGRPTKTARSRRCRDGARKLNPSQLARDNWGVALKEHRAKDCVVGFVREVRAHDRARIGV